MTGIAFCCARTVSGKAATAQPSRTAKSRRVTLQRRGLVRSRVPASFNTTSSRRIRRFSCGVRYTWFPT